MHTAGTTPSRLAFDGRRKMSKLFESLRKEIVAPHETVQAAPAVKGKIPRG